MTTKPVPQIHNCHHPSYLGYVIPDWLDLRIVPFLWFNQILDFIRMAMDKIFFVSNTHLLFTLYKTFKKNQTSFKTLSQNWVKTICPFSLVFMFLCIKVSINTKPCQKSGFLLACVPVLWGTKCHYQIGLHFKWA